MLRWSSVHAFMCESAPWWHRSSTFGGIEAAQKCVLSRKCRLMHQRFLAGEDEGVDYRRLDRDASLDDDWAAEQQQDAEDAYFDTVEG